MKKFYSQDRIKNFQQNQYYAYLDLIDIEFKNIYLVGKLIEKYLKNFI